MLWLFCLILFFPGSMVVRPGQSLTIDCKVSYSVTSYYSAWIRQPAGKALEWIGYMYSDGSTAYSDKLKSKFSFSRDTGTNTITLRGQNLQTEDTAVYYCARHTVTLTNEHGLQKPRADTQLNLKGSLNSRLCHICLFCM
uniref:Ig-like domain-containing protein n=1 Tax=Pygocentrus nattereri TaxID=42514 RepID=A0A3B4EH36_PYGNA